MGLLDWIKQILGISPEIVYEEDSMKFLIAGLGNIGADYENTRHNIGFNVVDAIAEKAGATFKNDTLADIAEVKHKGRTLILIKPTTYMNRSGKSVNYWMTKHKISKENLLVVLDDLNLDYGVIRMRGKGSDGGHNGLKDIDATLAGNDYARLRIGIGNKFKQGQQVDFVLGKWDDEEKVNLDKIIKKSADASKSFAAIGLKFTMENFNKPIKLEDKKV